MQTAKQVTQVVSCHCTSHHMCHCALLLGRLCSSPGESPTSNQQQQQQQQPETRGQSAAAGQQQSSRKRKHVNLNRDGVTTEEEQADALGSEDEVHTDGDDLSEEIHSEDEDMALSSEFQGEDDEGGTDSDASGNQQPPGYLLHYVLNHQHTHVISQHTIICLRRQYTHNTQ